MHRPGRELGQVVRGAVRERRGVLLREFLQRSVRVGVSVGWHTYRHNRLDLRCRVTCVRERAERRRSFRCDHSDELIRVRERVRINNPCACGQG